MSRISFILLPLPDSKQSSAHQQESQTAEANCGEIQPERRRRLFDNGLSRHSVVFIFYDQSQSVVLSSGSSRTLLRSNGNIIVSEVVDSRGCGFSCNSSSNSRLSVASHLQQVITLQ